MEEVKHHWRETHTKTESDTLNENVLAKFAQAIWDHKPFRIPGSSFHLAAKYTSVMYLTTSFLYCTVHNPKEERRNFPQCFRLISVDKGELNDTLALYTSITIWFPTSGFELAKSESRTDFTSASSQGCLNTFLFLCANSRPSLRIRASICAGNYLSFCGIHQSNGISFYAFIVYLFYKMESKDSTAFFPSSFSDMWNFSLERVLIKTHSQRVQYGHNQPHFGHRKTLHYSIISRWNFCQVKVDEFYTFPA